jgi:hypothetical protein
MPIDRVMKTVCNQTGNRMNGGRAARSFALHAGDIPGTVGWKSVTRHRTTRNWRDFAG